MPRNSLRFFSVLFCFLLIVSSSSIFCFSETKNTVTDEKVYDSATIEDEFVSGEVLVTIKKESSSPNKEWSLADFSNVEATEIIDLLRAENEETLNLIDPSNFRQILKIKLNEPTKEAVLEAIAQLEQLDFVRAAYPNMTYQENPAYPVQLTETPMVASAETTQSTSLEVLPNDHSYNLTEFYQMSLPDAWNFCDSSDVLIGVVDTGIDNTHPDLQGRIVENLGVNITNDGLGPHDDMRGHGTHVAGIIGAIGNNNTGVAGVCWGGAQIVSIKVLKRIYVEGKPYSYTQSDWVISAVQYAIQNNIPILNMSFMLRQDDINTWLEDVIGGYNGLVICSAGNDSWDNDNEEDSYNHYPSDHPCYNIIAVASITESNQLSTFSNYGATKVDLAAPGELIYSTVPGAQYESMGGTSMAAPYVTGVAALIMSLTDGTLTNEQIKDCILDGTDPVAALSGKCVTGGKLNAYRALRNALEMGQSTTVAGDFDGDGVDELAAFYGWDKFMSLIYWENNGGKFNMQEGSVVCTSDDYRVSNIAGQVAAGDFDGDGIDEIGALYDYGDYLGYWVFKRQSNGRFNAAKPGNTGSFITSIQNRVTSGDFDGDGREELFALYNYSGSMGWWIFKQKVDGGLTHYCVGQTGVLNVNSIDNRIAGGDFDGDGRDEVGILYDNTANYTEMMILDYSTSNTFSYYTVGQTGYFGYGNMKGLISAGDYDGDGTDEMMGLYGHDQNTDAPYFRIWIFERTATGSFYHYNSELYGTFRTSRIANTMVTGKFSSSTARDVMAGIYRYDDTTARVFAFGRPSNSTWAYDELE